MGDGRFQARVELFGMSSDGGGFRRLPSLTPTVIQTSASIAPTKLLATGTTWRMSRGTATGSKFVLPTLGVVGSKVIPPTPGASTSAQAWGSLATDYAGHRGVQVTRDDPARQVCRVVTRVQSRPPSHGDDRGEGRCGAAVLPTQAFAIPAAWRVDFKPLSPATCEGGNVEGVGEFCV